MKIVNRQIIVKISKFIDPLRIQNSHRNVIVGAGSNIYIHKTKWPVLVKLEFEKRSRRAKTLLILSTKLLDTKPRIAKKFL